MPTFCQNCGSRIIGIDCHNCPGPVFDPVLDTIDPDEWAPIDDSEGDGRGQDYDYDCNEYGGEG